MEYTFEDNLVALKRAVLLFRIKIVTKRKISGTGPNAMEIFNFINFKYVTEIKISGTGGELPQVLQARGNFALRCLRKEVKVSPREPFAYTSLHINSSMCESMRALDCTP